MSACADARVLVTGATTGLGRAMAEALSTEGARVVLTGRDRKQAEAAASAVGGIGLALDVRDEASVRACVEQTCAQLGGIDVLVNNAGIGMRTVNPRFMTEPQPFWRVTADGFRDVLDTKATGCFLMARAVVELMLAQGAGRIVNISMNEQTMTRQGFVPYGPAGAAVEALSRVMAADLADSPVRVNLLLPGGATHTGMVPDDVSDDVRRRLLPPSIMGPPIVWLASPEAADVHNERIAATDFSEWLARGRH